MRSLAPVATSLVILTSIHGVRARDGGQDVHITVQESGFPQLRGEYTPTPTVRPGMLAEFIDTFAGQTVRVPFARIVGVFEPNVLLIDSKGELHPLAGNRARILVLIDDGALRVSPALLVGSTVTVSGIARTLLGMRMTGEVPWPATLTPEQLQKLEIKGAILADSLSTADGVELTNRPSSGAPSDHPRKRAPKPSVVRTGVRPPS